MRAILVVLTFCAICTQTVTTKRETDSQHDGFARPVKRVFVESLVTSSSYVDLKPGSRCRHSTDLYDKNGRLMQHSGYAGSCGEDEIRVEYSFSQDGSRTSKTTEIWNKSSPQRPPGIARSGPQETGPPRTVFTYDTSGRLIEEASVSPSGLINYMSRFRYDAKGRLIEIAGHVEGKVTVRRVYSYTGDNRVPSGFTYYGGDNKVYEKTSYSEYEFNSFGDWVKRKENIEETLNRKHVFWTLRQIEYYPH
jgi:hypothetical protein